MKKMEEDNGFIVFIIPFGRNEVKNEDFIQAHTEKNMNLSIFTEVGIAVVSSFPRKPPITQEIRKFDRKHVFKCAIMF